jgi:hypothetical protein
VLEKSVNMFQTDLLSAKVEERQNNINREIKLGFLGKKYNEVQKNQAKGKNRIHNTFLSVSKVNEMNLNENGLPPNSGLYESSYS